VNHLPSLNTDSPLDYDIKRRLIDQALDITCSHLSATDSEAYARRSSLGPASCHLLEEPRYKDFVRAFPPTEDCPPELAAQYASVQTRVREVFNPIVTGGFQRDSPTYLFPRASYYRRMSYSVMPSSRSAWAEDRTPRRPMRRCPPADAADAAVARSAESALCNAAKLRDLQEASSRSYLESADISGLPPDVIRERRRTALSLPQKRTSEPTQTTCSGQSQPRARTPRPRRSRGEERQRSSTRRKCSVPASGYSAMHAAKVAQSRQRASWVSTI